MIACPICRSLGSHKMDCQNAEYERSLYGNLKAVNGEKTLRNIALKNALVQAERALKIALEAVTEVIDA
jgi:hypothetical protein